MLNLDAGEIEFWQRAYASALAAGYMDPCVRADRAVMALRDRICGPRVTCECGEVGWCSGDAPNPLGWSIYSRGMMHGFLCPVCTRRHEQDKHELNKET